MKKNMMYAAALAMGLAFAATSCSNSDEPQAVNPADLEYSEQNANSWHNYMGVVAKLLEKDSNTIGAKTTTPAVAVMPRYSRHMMVKATPAPSVA